MSVKTTIDSLKHALEGKSFNPQIHSGGIVTSIKDGVAIVDGLNNVGMSELVEFDSGVKGMV
jgi:F0F1-type ATP synthase alpha subunit